MNFAAVTRGVSTFIHSREYGVQRGGTGRSS